MPTGEIDRDPQEFWSWMSVDYGELKEVERSPNGRYIRFDKKLGDGAYKAVWLGLDTESGVEVAWNLLDFRRVPPVEREKLRLETEILNNVSHENIIDFYDVWEQKDADQIIFTTERMTSGTLKQFIRRLHPVRLKVVKKWCRQILRGLIYLHNQPVPIIHRDLKCDNIFINGNAGDIRIGDLGLSTMRNQTHAYSVLGTPEFMAPELYDEFYNELVDIYAFGMCVLEMVTNEYPYEECSNAAQIFKKVSLGTQPEAIQRIKHEPTRQFIYLCLREEEHRPSALELYNHPYLAFKSSDCRDSGHARYVSLKPPPRVNSHVTLNTDTNPALVTAPEIILESIQGDTARIVLRLHVGSKRKEIKFPFDLLKDTAEAVAAEMVKELNLDSSARVQLADGIFLSIRNERDLWKGLVRNQDIPQDDTEPEEQKIPQEHWDHHNAPSRIWLQISLLDDTQLKEKSSEYDLDTDGLSRKEIVYNLVDKICMMLMTEDRTVEQLQRKIVDEIRPEFIRVLVTNYSADFAANHLEELERIDKARTKKLQIQKRAYLAAKMNTNREFNTQATDRLDEWGVDYTTFELPALQSFKNSKERRNKQQHQTVSGVRRGGYPSDIVNSPQTQ